MLIPPILTFWHFYLFFCKNGITLLAKSIQLYPISKTPFELIKNSDMASLLKAIGGIDFGFNVLERLSIKAYLHVPKILIWKLVVGNWCEVGNGEITSCPWSPDYSYSWWLIITKPSIWVALTILPNFALYWRTINA